MKTRLNGLHCFIILVCLAGIAGIIKVAGSLPGHNQIAYGILFYVVAGTLAGLLHGLFELRLYITQQRGQFPMVSGARIVYLLSGVPACLATYGLFYLLSLATGISTFSHYPDGFFYILILIPLWFGLVGPQSGKYLVNRYISKHSSVVAA